MELGIEPGSVWLVIKDSDHNAKRLDLENMLGVYTLSEILGRSIQLDYCCCGVNFQEKEFRYSEFLCTTFDNLILKIGSAQKSNRYLRVTFND